MADRGDQADHQDADSADDPAVGMSVAVRPAVTGDAPRIAELLTELGYPVTAAEAGHRLAYWLNDPMSLVLVAELDGLVAGSVSLHAIPYLERTGRWARIESLVVAESRRGSGAGRALVAAAEQAAIVLGCLAVEVTSARHRTGAHAFYRRLGYADACDRSGRFLKDLPTRLSDQFAAEFPPDRHRRAPVSLRGPLRIVRVPLTRSILT